MTDEEKPKVRRLDEQLQKAILSKDQDADATAAMLLRNGASPFTHDDGFDPLFKALRDKNAMVAAAVIEAIIQRSQRFKSPGVLDEAETREAVAINLLRRTEHDHEWGCSPLEIAAGSDAEGMLETVWGYFKDKVDINQSNAHDGYTLVHYAAISPDNLKYLLAEGAHIDAPDKLGRTPLMLMFDRSFALSFSAAIGKLIEIYKAHKADMHAVDKEGHGLPFHALGPSVGGKFEFPRMRCVDWALTEGLDFLATDKNAKTPIDHFMDNDKLQWLAISDVFKRLAEHGYNVPALLQKYDGRDAIKEASQSLEEPKGLVCKLLEQSNLADKLWNPDGTPTTRMLSAFGYAVPGKIFENPVFRDDPAAAKALYEAMEAKLPPQCKDLLHTSIDLSSLRGAARPATSSAIADALKRKKSRAYPESQGMLMRPPAREAAMSDTKPEASEQNTQLREAIRWTRLPDACRLATECLHNGASPLPHKDGYDPLFAALGSRNVEMARIIIEAIIARSQIYKSPGVLDEEKTQEALTQNLYRPYRPTETGNMIDCAPLIIAQAAGNDTQGMLAMVWGYFKGKVDINWPGALGVTPIHAATIHPDNLEYLLAEGANINERNKQGQTPLLNMLERAADIDSPATAERLLKIYETHKADLHAVDHRGRGVPFYVLMPNDKGMLTHPQMKCLNWACAKGFSFFTKDIDGNTPAGRFLNNDKLSHFTVTDAFKSLVRNGHNIPAMLQKHTSKPVLRKSALPLMAIKRAVRKQLSEDDFIKKLWNTEGAPSRLMLYVFGYGMPHKIFEHPSLKNDPAAAKALYEAMEAKLPPQCKDLLHTSIDLSSLRGAARPAAPSAIAKALKRKNSPPDPSAGPPGRNP